MLLCDSRKGRERYIWYNPPQKRKMYFQDGLHITNGTFNVPGVIYVVERECMDIHAFKGTIPEERTELYLAPFFNVTGADVCLGNSSLKKPRTWIFRNFGILGKAFLDERVLTFGRRAGTRPAQSGFSNRTCTEQSV